MLLGTAYSINMQLLTQGHRKNVSYSVCRAWGYYLNTGNSYVTWNTDVYICLYPCHMGITSVLIMVHT